MTTTTYTLTSAQLRADRDRLTEIAHNLPTDDPMTAKRKADMLAIADRLVLLADMLGMVEQRASP